MREKAEIRIDEIKRVFEFLEEINDLFHQPEKYKNPEIIADFAAEKYPEIKELYYKIVWNWLPEKTRNEIEEK